MNKGSYVLVLNCNENKTIVIKSKKITLRKGYYLYVGSAMKNLYQRVGRHVSFHEGKYKSHWHIDKLLDFCIIEYAIMIPDGLYRELDISILFSKHFKSIKGFGASDLKIDSNLYYTNNLIEFFDLMKFIK